MTHNHLTPEQLYLHLEDPNLPHTHLQSCAACREELTQLRATFANLRLSLTALAEQQSIRPPVPTIARHRPRVWALAAAVLLFILALVPAFRHAHTAQPAIAPHTATSSDQDDQALLEGIDHDLSTSIAPPLTPLAMGTTRQ